MSTQEWRNQMDSNRPRRDREELDDRPDVGEQGSAFDAGGLMPDRVATMKAYAYRGLGPRGYQRSDQRIHEDVCEALTEDAHLDASSLEVEVKDGEVTLSGTVESRPFKRHAEAVVERVMGVRDVHNHLRIAVPADHFEKGEAPDRMSPQDGVP
ncbi:MAG: BON domain-containing protein [Povalibacter sp.]|jgi:hypothetical protein